MPANIPLHPDIRDLYGASLRPPPGTVFDGGVATSFSLEFETALAIPVTLALFTAENRDELLASPLALLEGLERTADRLVIFCEAGRIQAHSQPQSRLCALLERMIVEVTAPNGGAFHPKIWVLRYRPLDPNEPTRLRLLVLSRNLTRDKSWDLSLRLDGTVGPNRRDSNLPLLELVKRLPLLSTTPLPEHVNPLVASILEDLERTEWSLPTPFESVSFAVNGIGNDVWSPSPCNRMGIISPFCDGQTLNLLADRSSREGPRIVSRSEELISVPSSVLERCIEVLVMDELAESEDGEGDDHDAGDEAVRPLSGLHAKAFVQEIGWDTAITVGSGNATRPALITGRNVEVFATLTGKRSSVGSIADILGPGGFGAVLRPFHAAEVAPIDSERRAAEECVERARHELATAGLRLRCLREPAQGDSRISWRLQLQSEKPLILDRISLASTWPITRGEAHARDFLDPLRQELMVEVGSMQLVDVTRFLAFRLEDESGKAQAVFTLGLELEGLPADRHRAILRWVIDSREAFLRYLRLLLSDLSDPFAAQLAAGQLDGSGNWGEATDDEPVLEDMVRALAHGGDRLHAVHRLMERLAQNSDEDETDVVPDDFAELWAAFRTVLVEQRSSDA